jgi:predicted alpha-1,6-mannanase (GH76 family)
MLAIGAGPFLDACATNAPKSLLSVTAPAAAAQRDASPEAGSRYVEQAAAGAAKLQSWYSQNSGLYETTGWWNSANAITVLANYSQVSHSSLYLPVFANTFEQAQKTARGFINEYYDDEGWWALAWIAAYDLTGNERYLSMAHSIFHDMAGGWDQTCGGGIWWSKEKKYKNAIVNELFLSVSAHLAVRSRSSSERAEYLRWAAREWQWFSKSGMINSQNLINDGLDLGSCKNNEQTVWTYNQGVILGGLVELNRAAPDPALLSTAVGIASAALTHLRDANGVFHDPCEPACAADNVQFKGIFLRNLMALNEVFPNAGFKAFTGTNAESLWKYSQGPHHEFGQVWSGPFRAGDAGSQSSALDAFVAAAQMEQRRAR